MNEYNIKRSALIYALVFEVEAMKIENLRREKEGYLPIYNELVFWDRAEDMRELAYKHDEQL